MCFKIMIYDKNAIIKRYLFSAILLSQPPVSNYSFSNTPCRDKRILHRNVEGYIGDHHHNNNHHRKQPMSGKQHYIRFNAYEIQSFLKAISSFA